MKMAILGPHAATSYESMLPGWDALEMSTMGGALGLGIAEEIGAIEVGKKAGLICLDISRPWFRPIRVEIFLFEPCL